MVKPTVLCERPLDPPIVGGGTYVGGVIGHPKLGSLPLVRTSTVVKLLPNGFETLNTVYEYLSDYDTEEEPDES